MDFITRRIGLFLSLIFHVIFFGVTIQAIYSVGWQSRAYITGDESSLFDWLAFLLVVFAFLWCFLFRNKFNDILGSANTFLAKGSDRKWLLVLLLSGLAARLIYLLLFPASPSSDGAVYLSLAGKLLGGEPYSIANTYAYWPPGYPLFMVPWLALFPAKLAVALSNAFLFVCTLTAVYLSIKDILSRSAARAAGLMIVFWPNLIALFATPEKEGLVIAIFSLVLFAITRPRSVYGMAYLFAIGVLLGFASLVQPSFLLLFFAVTFSYLVIGRPLQNVVAATVIVVFGMALVITPWSYRNYKVFNDTVLITSNGGSNFYRVNNPLADGRYQPEGEIDFSHLNEIDASSAAYSAALDWIKSNPGDFLHLSLKKQLILLGDDATGFYTSMKRGGLDVSKKVYFAGKGLANLYWLLLWVFVLMGCLLTRWRDMNLLEIFSRLIILYLWGVHTFFESAPKYHVPASIFIVVLIVCLLPLSGVNCSFQTPDGQDR